MRLLNDPLGDRTEQRPGDEVAASTPNDQEVGAHLTGGVDEHHGRVAGRRQELDPHLLRGIEQTQGFVEQALRIERAIGRLWGESHRAQVGRNRNHEHFRGALTQAAGSSERSPGGV